MNAPTVHLEPARFGMTGPICGIGAELRSDFDPLTVQPLDAPFYLPRGSVSAYSPLQPGGVQYASTTNTAPGR